MRSLWGGCLIAAGTLIALVSGLCTLMSSAWDDLLTFGGSFAIGLGLIVVGHRLSRESGHEGGQD